MDRFSKKLFGLSYLLSVALFLSIPEIRESPILIFSTLLLSLFNMFLVALVITILIEFFKALEKWIMK
jgi:hypothetical protein